MKIGETRPVADVAQVSGKRGPSTSKATAAKSECAANNSATGSGIPEAELTPRVRAALTELMEEVSRLRREVEAARAHAGHLERMADQDSLVPVFNRRAFVRELSRVLSFSERYGTPSSVLYFDINSFKTINDTYGHAAGDEALEHIAQVLLDQVRESDMVGRLGGDEFGVILTHTDANRAREKAEQLTQSIESVPVEWEGQQITLQVAYGVYSFAHGDDARTALEQADKAMYRHKSKLKRDEGNPSLTQ